MIEVTTNAIGQIKRIQEQDPAIQDAMLRIRVVGGGCSGMSYEMDFDKEGAQSGDEIIEREGVKLVVDQKSLLFLKGTTLDFSSGLQGRGFEFVNPNAKRTCGCGSSFSV